VTAGTLAAGIRALNALQRYERHINPTNDSKASADSYEEESDKALAEVEIAAKTDADRTLKRALDLYQNGLKVTRLSLQLDPMSNQVARIPDDEKKSQNDSAPRLQEIQSVLDTGTYSFAPAEASKCGKMIF
jgi:hypothetical protein